MKNGSIVFPHETETTVWSPELELHWNNPDVEILGGWVIECNISIYPFEFYRDLFDRRNYLKSIGNPAEYAIKITINAGYGKLAQRAGAKLKKDGKWRIPPFHQLDWAGYITSHCRANIWRAIMCVGWENVISIETDGIFTTKRINVDTLPVAHCTTPITIGKKLGEWEETQWDGMIAIQSGIYWLRSDDEWIKAKQRGLRRLGTKGIGGMAALEFLQQYEFINRSTTMESTVTQFHGIGRITYSNWLSWATSIRQISFGGTGKRRISDTSRVKPSNRLVFLHNRSVEFTVIQQSHPHPLPWSTYGNMQPKNEWDDLQSNLILEKIDE